jgi:hypothetical protein
MRVRFATGIAWGRAYAGAMLLAAALSARGSQVLTNADAEALASAVAKGGDIVLAFDGTVNLSHELVVVTNTTIDGTGHSVVLDAGGLTRHLLITNAPTVQIINLTLINGRAVGAAGGTNQSGADAWGGSIYSPWAELSLLNCSFASNAVTGGLSGPGLTAVAGGGSAYGGAICLLGGPLLVKDCVFTCNTAIGGLGSVPRSPAYYPLPGGPGGDAYGGAIYCGDGCPATRCASGWAMTMSAVVFRNNAAEGGDLLTGPYSGGSAYGGAVANASKETAVNGCTFDGNQASAKFSYITSTNLSGFAFGGAFFQGGQIAKIDGSFFVSNSVTGGGSNGDSNVGGGDGGGLYCRSGNVSCQNSAFILNQAAGGGNVSLTGLVPGGTARGAAIYSGVSATNFQLINCTLAQNSATGGTGGSIVGGGPRGLAFGGAVFGSVSLVNVTIASNVVTGGVMTGVAASSGSSVAALEAHLVNTILACGPGQTNVVGAYASGTRTYFTPIDLLDAGHNLSSDGSAQFYQATSRNNLNPLLGPLGTYGGSLPAFGSLPVFGLLPNSPAIDAGNDSVCPPTDERGALRPSGLACDIGAFELTPTLRLVSSGGSLATAQGSFQASRTNLVSRTTDFLAWASLGPRVADTNGVFAIEQVDLSQTPLRFYKIEPQR